MQKITKSFAFLYLAIMFSTISIYSQNLLVNGDFESGGNGVGFNLNGSGYNLITGPFSGTTAPGDYAFTTNPQPMNTGFFLSGGDHTSGSGKMMVIDGNTTGGQQRFWRAGNSGGGVCGLTVGLTYTFSFWIKSVSTNDTNAATLASLGLQFGNVTSSTLISGSLTAPLPAIGWRQIVYHFVPFGSCVTIEIFNLNTGAVGNDFAVDDFLVSPPPLPLAMTYSFTNPSCASTADGLIAVYGINGVKPYTNYTLSGAASQSNTTGIFSGLGAGTYSVSINDSASGTSSASNIVLTAPADLTLSLPTTICSGTSTTLNVSGSTAAYAWTASPADATLITPTSASPAVSPIVTTTYTATSSPSTAVNLLYNGDFSQGNVGFTSDYFYYLTNPTGIQRAYGMVSNPNTWEAGFINCPDHTSGSGQMMVVDGSTFNAGNDRVWGQTIAVNSGQSYTFSFFLQTLSAGNPAVINVLINGTQVLSATASSTVCGWTQYSYIWNSGASTIAQISIYDRTIIGMGNDFALDDIVFTSNNICNLSKSVIVTVNPKLIPAITCGGTTASSVTFNWAAVTGASNYTLSYTINAGPVVSGGSTIATTFTVNSLSPADSVKLTVTPTGTGCFGPGSQTCIVSNPCPTPLVSVTIQPTCAVPTGTIVFTSPVNVAPLPIPTDLFISEVTDEDIGSLTYIEIYNGTGVTKNLANYRLKVYNNGNALPSCDLLLSGTLLNNAVVVVSVGSVINMGGVVPNLSFPACGGVNSNDNIRLTTSANAPIDLWGRTDGVNFTPLNQPGYTYRRLQSAPHPSLVWNAADWTVLDPQDYTDVGSYVYQTSNFQYSVDGTTYQVSATFTGLVPNIYNVGVKDLVSGCISNPIALTVNPVPTIAAPTASATVQPTCSPTTGTIVVSAPTGSNFEYSINGVYQTSSSFPGLAPNTYNVTVRNTTSGCVSAPTAVTINPYSAAPAAPVVTTPVYYCQNDPTPAALSATALPGAVLNWYGTNSTGGASSSTATIPTVNAVGSFTYYVSQTVGACESPRAAIVVKVVANNGASIMNFVCDPSQATAPNTAFFDWSNVLGNAGYNYSYTISGGSTVTGYTNLSHYEVGLNPGPSLSPGQAVTFTILSVVGLPCVPSVTRSCSAPCAAAVIPTFSSIPSSVCSGSSPAALPLISDNAISGTWSPSAINNTISRSYVFTPDPVLFPCALSLTKGVTITPSVTPTFTAIPASVCQNDPAPVLPTTSSNVPAITGTWNSTVNTTAVGPTIYTFTPASGSCASATNKTITVNANVTPDFAPIPDFCSGTTAPSLTNSAPNGITGTWSPATISNTIGRNYLFTPNAGQCATTQTLTVTITPVTTPNFAAILPICSGTTAPILQTNSPNSISGTWSPSTISNTVGANYQFKPDPVLFPCAASQILTVTILPRITPTFAAIPTSVCQNASAPVLQTSSTNSPSITGTWNPTVINTSTLGSAVYTFTPSSGFCSSVALTTVSITITSNVSPNFAPIPAFCSGTTAPLLSNQSPNLITGTWSPPTISNTIGRNYIFTPNAGQCATNQTLTVTITPIATPNFAPIPPICSGTPAPTLQTVSPNAISGTWLPATINNTVGGNYTFTPNPSLFPCAVTQTLTVTILPGITPTFATIPSTVCLNAAAPILPTSSSNVPPITGTWNAPVNTTTVGPTVYTFTPNAAFCTSSTLTTTSITITPNTTPNFAPIPDFCSGTAAPLLSNLSPNLISGAWMPATISNTASGNYLFTPSPGQCAVTQTLTVTIISRIIPLFSPIPPFCVGSAAPVLPLISNNLITGTWFPTTVNNSLSSTYFFTPDANQCADLQSLIVTVNQLTLPNFDDIAFCFGGAVPSLQALSPNGISGTWFPVIINATTNGTYLFTPNPSECASQQTIKVTVNQAVLVSVDWNVTNAFTDNQIITVLPSAAGNYLYELDFGALQTSNIFENVATGIHTIKVIDVNGCSSSITKDDVLIINYPKYFTPNGDDFNDTWNIFGLKGQLNSLIFIYDRYGKLLKQITPEGLGWDGTFIGRPLPSSDYWFTVEYTENNITQTFKSHFSLKR